MENIKDIWKDENFLSHNLTIKDVVDLLEHITPWLKGMELKFSWDYLINDPVGENDKIWELVRDKILEISKDVLN